MIIDLDLDLWVSYHLVEIPIVLSSESTNTKAKFSAIYNGL